jgi:phosphotransferase system IIA component
MVKQRRGGENVNTEQNIFETNLQKIAQKKSSELTAVFMILSKSFKS